MNKDVFFRPFREGFVGAFVLAASIVTAVVAVATTFVHGDRHQDKNHSHSN